MEEMTTYTRRENARRAAVEAGVPAERVKITVHKNKDEVRFGWKEATPNGDTGWLQQRPGAPATITAAVTETRTSRPHNENSTPKRPKAGGKCAAVWDYLDANPTTTVKELRDAAAGQGWNVNNAVCELYAWRKFIQQAHKAGCNRELPTANSALNAQGMANDPSRGQYASRRG